MCEEEIRKHPRELVIFWACDCAERALLREQSKGREPDFRSWNAVSVTRMFLKKRVTVEFLEGIKKEAWSAYESAQSDWIEYMRRTGVKGSKAPAGGRSSSSAQAAQCAVSLAAWPSEGSASWEFPFMAKQAPNHAMRAAQWSAGGIAGSVRDAVYVAETAWQKRRLSWLAECWESYGEECLDLIFRGEIPCPEDAWIDFEG